MNFGTGEGSLLESDFFRQVVSDNITYTLTPAGLQLTLQGRVVLDSPQLTIQCDQMTLDPATKQVVATGNPIQVRQGEMRAQCQRLTNDLEKKTLRLTGNARVFAKRGGKYICMNASVITLTQGSDGKYRMELSQGDAGGKINTMDFIEKSEFDKLWTDQTRPMDEKAVQAQRAKIQALFKQTAQAPPPDAGLADLGDDLMIKGVHSEISRDGMVMQKMEAARCRWKMDEDVLDLGGMKVSFYDQGAPKGEASCGTGRVWMSDKLKAEGHNPHDIALSDGVEYRFADSVQHFSWLLRTPSMQFDSVASTLRSDAGYLTQLGLGPQSYLLGAGVGFTIKVLVQKATFESWKEYGDPAVLEKSDKPEIEK